MAACLAAVSGASSWRLQAGTTKSGAASSCSPGVAARAVRRFDVKLVHCNRYTLHTAGGDADQATAGSLEEAPRPRIRRYRVDAGAGAAVVEEE